MTSWSGGEFLKPRIQIHARPGAWFWRLIGARRNVSIVGVAASEAEALGEARAALSEMGRDDSVSDS
ncbi:MAG: hypothetical protein ACREQX_02400 [Candidatus Binataceae bacterium]